MWGAAPGFVWFICVFVALYPDGGLTGKDTLPTQDTTLEALLRGEGRDQRNNSKDEESLLEIQVGPNEVLSQWLKGKGSTLI